MILTKTELTSFFNGIRKVQAQNHFYFSYFQQIDCKNWNFLKDGFLENDSNYFFCSHSNNRFSLLAYDELISVTEEYMDRYSSIQEVYKKIKPIYFSNASDFSLTYSPFIFCAAKFPSKRKDELWAEFPETKWTVPKFILLKDNERYFLAINGLYYENIEDYLEYAVNKFEEKTKVVSSRKQFYSKLSESILDEWSIKIDCALKNISEKTIDKIVLARFIDLELTEQPSMNEILNSLGKKYPECLTFSCKSGKSIFFGATPEKLFSLSNGIFHADALAGSCPRGDSDASDIKLQHELLHDTKNLNEHNAVTKFFIEQLSSLVDHFTIEEKPTVKKLSNIQHLYTPVKANIKTDISVFDILKKLFPTPAVCGIPPLRSQELIEEIEDFERGLYAGAIGWLGLNNSAEMYVGIRSALLKGTHVRAFAGGGIVEGSESKEEFNETNLKLKPILSLFENENIG